MPYVDLRTRSRAKPKHTTLKALAFFAFFGLLGALAWVVFGKVTTLAPLSVVSNIIKPKVLSQTDGWTNVLLLGIDARPEGNVLQGESLTDTILVVSFNLQEKKVLLTSIPRDLYIAESGSKINSIYALNNASVEAVKGAVEKVLGITVHYYVLVDFQGFIKGIDTLGGLDITVPETFNDYYYPIQDRETATCGLDVASIVEQALANNTDPAFDFPCRFEQLHFIQGLTHMDGTLALKYARSRHAEGSAGSDFDRARRQQLVIEAAKEKALSLDTLVNPGKLQTLFQTYSQFVQTSIDVSDLLPFYNAAKSLAATRVQSIVLSDSSSYGEGGGLLVSRINDNGLWVIEPRVSDYSEIHALVRRKFMEALPVATPSAVVQK